MLLHVKGVFLVCVGQIFIVRVLRDVEFIRKERAHTSKLQDTFSTVHDRDFVLCHKLAAGTAQCRDGAVLRSGSADRLSGDFGTEAAL